jgi:hypothetical protein
MHLAAEKSFKIMEITGYTFQQVARHFPSHIEFMPELKKQGFSRWNAPGETLLKSRQLEIKSLGNAHTDCHELAAVFTIRYVGVRPDL